MKTRKIVGKVTLEEKQVIQQLFERRNGLQELAKILTADNSDLYEKLLKDVSDTTAKFQAWWNEMNKKYQWESSEKGHWEIDFDTCEIYLIEEAV